MFYTQTAPQLIAVYFLLLRFKNQMFSIHFGRKRKEVLYPVDWDIHGLNEVSALLIYMKTNDFFCLNFNFVHFPNFDNQRSQQSPFKESKDNFSFQINFASFYYFSFSNFWTLMPVKVLLWSIHKINMYFFIFWCIYMSVL